MNELLVTNVKKMNDMKEAIDYNDREIMEMEAQSIFTQLEEQCNEKEIEVKKKGSNNYSLNRIFVLCLLIMCCSSPSNSYASSSFGEEVDVVALPMPLPLSLTGVITALPMPMLLPLIGEEVDVAATLFMPLSGTTAGLESDPTVAGASTLVLVFISLPLAVGGILEEPASLLGTTTT
ncbi:hypothetical protein H5410_061825 [Solanum commersonii]|uniref:Uncharacterized protein n=1 Tax=Solanum commersonii TaxID=4109 RepID=A0A9J5W8S3_SOLCO|nr:hypothetical protein H5410_061825 [Solanum commersonii]